MSSKKLNTNEIHYLNCINTECEKVFCVERRELESKLKKALKELKLVHEESHTRPLRFRGRYY